MAGSGVGPSWAALVLNWTIWNVSSGPSRRRAWAAARLAMASGAIYLRDVVPVNTPPELAEPIAALAKQLQDAAQHFFVGQTSGDPEQSARLAAAAESTKKVADLCK